MYTVEHYYITCQALGSAWTPPPSCPTLHSSLLGIYTIFNGNKQKLLMKFLRYSLFPDLGGFVGETVKLHWVDIAFKLRDSYIYKREGKTCTIKYLDLIILLLAGRLVTHHFWQLLSYVLFGVIWQQTGLLTMKIMVLLRPSAPSRII